MFTGQRMQSLTGATPFVKRLAESSRVACSLCKASMSSAKVARNTSPRNTMLALRGEHATRKPAFY